MGAKALVLFPLGRRFGMCGRPAALKLAAVLSQGGEFAFVLFAIAKAEGTLADPLIDEMTLAVALSMALTPLVYWLAERSPADGELAERREFDTPDDGDHDGHQNDRTPHHSPSGSPPSQRSSSEGGGGPARGGASPTGHSDVICSDVGYAAGRHPYARDLVIHDGLHE